MCVDHLTLCWKMIAGIIKRLSVEGNGGEDIKTTDSEETDKEEPEI